MIKDKGDSFNSLSILYVYMYSVQLPDEYKLIVAE